jgi:hypothetical protein
MTTELIFDIVQTLGLGALIVLNVIRTGAMRRTLRRQAIARAAVDYAEQLGGSSEQKKAHALGYAQIIDKADNGKRDFADIELGVEIESTLGARQK